MTVYLAQRKFWTTGVSGSGTLAVQARDRNDQAFLDCRMAYNGGEEIFPYQSSDWRYLEIPLYGTPPVGWETESFDDSGWSVGQGAFGSGGGCSLQANTKSRWNPLSEILIRRFVSYSSSTATSVVFYAEVDNDYRAFFGGSLIKDWEIHEGCPSVDQTSATWAISAVTSAPIIDGWGQETPAIYSSGGKRYFNTKAEVFRGTMTVFDQSGKLLLEKSGYQYADTTSKKFEVIDSSVTGIRLVTYYSAPRDLSRRLPTKRVTSGSVYADRVRMNDITGF